MYVDTTKRKSGVEQLSDMIRSFEAHCYTIESTQNHVVFLIR